MTIKISRLGITVFLGLAVAVWAIVLWVKGVPLSWELFTPFGLAVSILAGIGWLFESWAWAWPVVSLLSQRPDIRGTWSVELKSNWKDPITGDGIPPIQCYAAITQSLSKLQLKLMTPESQSWLMSSEFAPSNKSDGFELYGVYTNEPKRALRDTRSPIHNGALRIELHGLKLKPDSMEGEYWTDRSTGGSLFFQSRNEKIFTTYSSAEADFTNSPS